MVYTNETGADGYPVARMDDWNKPVSLPALMQTVIRRLRHADDCIGSGCKGKSVIAVNRPCPCQCH